MKLALIACVTLAFPFAGAAQQPADTVTLKPVVVTATRLPTRADEVPVAVTVLSGADLRAGGIRTVADALRLVPAAHVVTTDAYGSQTSLFLRGGESDYVKVLIDGVPQNSPGGAFDFSNLTTDNVERIEVVRGPVSVLYGSDAVTGVVQIFTRDGAGALHGSVGAAGGTYGTGAVDASLAAGNARAGFSLGASRFSSSGVYALDNQYRNAVLSARAHFQPDARSTAALAFHYGDARYHFPTDGAGNVVSNNQHQLDRGPSAALDLSRAFSDRVDAHLTADWHRDNYQYAIAPNGPGDTTTFPYSSSDWVTRDGVDGRANVRVGGGEVVTLGAAFEREAMEGTTLGTARARNDGAAYAQVLTGLDRSLGFTLGGRLEDNQRFGTYGTYRAGASYRLSPVVRAIASVGTGFKEPSFYQNFATGFVRGNPNLRPEHSFSWETGVEYTAPGSRLGLRATYFDQRFRDLIDYNGADTVTNYFNVPGADARGVEVTGAAALGARARVSFGYTYLHTRVTEGGTDSSATGLFLTGRPLIRRPRHSATLGLGYRLAGRGSLDLSALYTGDGEDLDYGTFTRATLPSYLRVDLAVDYELVAGRGGAPGVAVSGRVENLFNRAYQEIRNFPARGRTLLFGAQVRFGS